MQLDRRQFMFAVAATSVGACTLPEVKAAIAKARPLIAGFGEYSTTEPVGGVGLAQG